MGDQRVDQAAPSLSNVVPRSYVTTSAIVAGGQAQTVVANGPTYRVVGLRLEMKL